MCTVANFVTSVPFELEVQELILSCQDEAFFYFVRGFLKYSEIDWPVD
jgi:hypothetical protein